MAPVGEVQGAGFVGCRNATTVTSERQDSGITRTVLIEILCATSAISASLPGVFCLVIHRKAQRAEEISQRRNSNVDTKYRRIKCE